MKSYNCNCPYDGAVCKHLAAVSLAIDESKCQEPVSENSQQLINAKESWKEFIEKVNPDDLRAFIINYGERETGFQHQVVIHFGEPKDGINQYQPKNNDHKNITLY